MTCWRACSAVDSGGDIPAVAADMAVATGVPDGHGHRYVKDLVTLGRWSCRPPAWTADKTERLRAMIQAPQ